MTAISVSAPPAPVGPTVSANVAAHLAALADRRGWSGRAAFLEGHRVWTHGEVHDRAERAATVLASRGVAAGDRVLLALPDGIMWVTTFLATARLGAVAVLVNPALTADDHRFMAEDSRTALAVSGPDLQDHFDRVPWLGADQLSALTGPPTTLGSAAPAPAAEPVTAATPLYVQYTSGTTGRPKAVVHSHGDVAAYHDLVGQEVLDIGPADVSFSVSKLFYAYGFGNAFAFPLFSGSAAVLTADRPGPALIDDLVARHRVTLLYSVPSSYAALVDERGTGHTACFASVRAAVSAGEGLPPALGERVGELLGAPVLEQIGSTEAGHAFCANTVWDNVPGTLGRPVPRFELELRDGEGAVVADGADGSAEGELWVRGPTVVTGHPRDGGWLATRDRARRERDGTYRHLGRVDDLEMVGGITVSPLEVEEVLRQHPSVREVAVAAVLDERGATRLRAYVVRAADAGGPDGSGNPGGPGGPGGSAVDEETLTADLIALARRRLAAYKAPRTVRLVDSLPRTPTGKLRRHVVRTGRW
ncbi:AMP-binding protein [Streptomyces sp. 5-10]|uniref:AMP-binding protein n=1 Tax=Streptomyces sp. 5-10 TaxID=878925 RepID=UPI00295E6D5B|nr:AMP-binding protein [Streptomyces sp. 5-10]